VDPDAVRRYESGQEEIPVSYLFHVAKACRVDLTALISGGEAHLRSHSLVRADQGLSVDRRKAYRYRSLAYRFVDRSMEPFVVTVDPKDEDELAFAEHEGQEFVYVLEGRLEVCFSGRTGERVAMQPGDSLYFDSRTPHAMRALDGAPARFLDVIS
jgi:mannose-6-phosphate isomerase-like protein (cupin superfamily)